MLQSMRSQTIGPTERLNDNTLTWPKVSPRTCVETKSTPPLGPPSHLCLEPVWKTVWVRNMGIFLGLEPGVSWAWQGGACGRTGEGCRPPCATHVPEQVGAGRGGALESPAVGARGPGKPEGDTVPSEAPCPLLCSSWPQQVDAWRWMPGYPPGPGLGSRLLLRPGICHRSARLTEPIRDPRNRPATEHVRCLLSCSLAPTVGLGRGCQPSKAGQQSLFRLLPWKFKCWEWR